MQITALTSSEERTPSMSFISICDIKYLSRFLVMLESLREYIANSPIFIVTLDNLSQSQLEILDLPNLNIIALDELNMELDGVVDDLASDRQYKEFIFALTPFLLLFLSKRVKSDFLVYVDADVCFVGDPLQIMRFRTATLGIFGHQFSDRAKHLEKYGKYNVGVVYFSRLEESERALAWWSEKCLESTSLDLISNPRVFGDQKYLDDVPLMFSGVEIHANQNYCKGPWNTNEIPDKGESSHPFFFHFSGLEIGRRIAIMGLRAYGWKPTEGTKDFYREYVLRVMHWESRLWNQQAFGIQKKGIREWLRIVKFRDYVWLRSGKRF